METRLYLTGGGVAWDKKRGIVLVAASSDPSSEHPSANLTWDGSRLSPRPEALQPDPTMKRGSGDSYVWTSPDLTMTLAPVAGAHTGTLTIVDQGKTTTLQCKAVDKLVRCDP